MRKLEQIVKSGNTRLIEVKLPDIASSVKVFAKLESENPTGSVKDRAAQKIIEELLSGENYVLDCREDEFGERKFVPRRLEYRPSVIILDSSSGNYGVSLAYFGRMYGLDVQLVVPGNIPRRLLQKIRDNGVEPIQTDPMEDYHGALKKVKELAKNPKYLYVNQYDNLGNLNAHRDGTGKEIWEQTNGELTHFVAGVGTGGTIIGATIYLKKIKPSLNVYSIHPSNFPGVQGLQPFVKPTYVKEPFIDGRIMSNIFEKYNELIINKVGVITEEAVKWWDWLRKSKFDVGMSSGANIAGIVKLIKNGNIKEGIVVTLFPDHLDRYKDM